MPTVRTKGLTRVGSVFAMVALSAGGLMLWLNNHLFETCPTQVDQQNGFIYPLDNRGHIVYLNSAEHLCMQATEACFAGSLLGSLGLGIWMRNKMQSGKTSVPDGGH